MDEFNQKDKDHMLEHICDEHATRVRKRADKDKIWAEIDRQRRMEPDLSVKKKSDGSTDESKAWLPETELPLQAQTLEVTTADARRMQFPDSGPWYTAHAAMTDAYLERVDFSAIIAGDENDIPSKITQDNADKLVEGVGNHWRAQYDFKGNMDLINAESISYGMGIGRGRLVSKRIFAHTARGVIKTEQKIPVLVPRSIRHIYLDTSQHRLQNEGFIVGPSTIAEQTILAKDLIMAAKKGGTDLETGGWIKSAFSGWDQTKSVQIIEWEGDMVVPRGEGDSLYLVNSIISVAIGTKDGKTAKTVFRIRKNPLPFSSYLEFPYHMEALDDPYGTSPLMKGYPVQFAATAALNRLIEAGALNTQPPISFDGDDQAFLNQGGPQIFPGAQWPTTGDIEQHKIGDPSALFAIYGGHLQQYADVTGISAPRLGAQTVSHTTAFAKETEISRGTIRTVDYVRNSLDGPLTRWLDMEFKMGRPTINKTTLFVPAYNGWVTLDKAHLPDEVLFEAFGSGGPAEEQAKKAERAASLQRAIQMDQLNMQTQLSIGQQPVPVIDIPAAIEQELSNGGWTDIDAIIRREAPAGGAGAEPGVAQTADPNPGAVSTALQTLAFSGQ